MHCGDKRRRVLVLQLPVAEENVTVWIAGWRPWSCPPLVVSLRVSPQNWPGARVSCTTEQVEGGGWADEAWVLTLGAPRSRRPDSLLLGIWDLAGLWIWGDLTCVANVWELLNYTSDSLQWYPLAVQFLNLQNRNSPFFLQCGVRPLALFSDPKWDRALFCLRGKLGVGVWVSPGEAGCGCLGVGMSSLCVGNTVNYK